MMHKVPGDITRVHVRKKIVPGFLQVNVHQFVFVRQLFHNGAKGIYFLRIASFRFGSM